MYRKVLSAALLMSISSMALAITPQDAANDVVHAGSQHEQCKVFFNHYMGYMIKEDYSDADSLISYIDEEDSSLVDYCDRHKDEYLDQYR